MGQKNFHLPFILISFFAAFFSYWIAFLLLSDESMPWYVLALCTGGVVAGISLISFAAVHIYNLLRFLIWTGKKAILPPLLLKKGILILALLFVTGFVSQTVYSLNVETTSNTKKAENLYDIALLLDCSDSVSDQSVAAEACKKLIQSVPEDNRMCFALFTTQIKKEFSLSPLTKNIREDYLDALNDLPQSGGTSLTKAVDWASSMLETSDGSGKKQLIILITDGSSPIHPSVSDAVLEAGIEVYCVRPSDEELRFTDELLTFVGDSNGFDTVVEDKDDLEQLNSLIDEYEGDPNAFKKKVKSHLVLESKHIMYDHSDRSEVPFGITVLRFAIQVLFFAVYSVLMQYYYFRSFGISTALFGILLAPLITAVIFAGSLISFPVLNAVVIAFIMHTLFSRIEVNDYV